VEIRLNTWDFGGQELYRITHQFFFSRRALYLLVWRPREGIEENAIEGWLRRIKLRVGFEARIIVVATYADEGRNPEIDFRDLQKRFPDTLVGHSSIDSKSGSGIAQLTESIAVAASGLPQMGEKISKRWIAARDEVLARPEPQIEYDDFVATCARHQLLPSETRTLVRLLHDLGHLIHYGDDDGLRNIVVLKPEWLTKAIGYVLEDRETRAAGGVLDHRRLAEIWENTAPSDRYPARYHPYFLRLMEKFDVSYRLPDDANASLVAQLVSHNRPPLPWDSPAYADSTARVLVLYVQMSDVAPGLVAWATVRNHRFSAGLNWRSGVFLRHGQYASEALIELDRANPRRLRIEVRAASPDYFFSIVRDSVEDLLKTVAGSQVSTRSSL
jgi:internalin A